MKLSARDAAGYFARPDTRHAGILIFGPDAMRVALRRQELVRNLIGPEGEAEMRLDRLQGGDLRSDPAALGDALRAQGFFPGARVVLVEDATDALVDAVAAALADRGKGDATLVVTAGNLKPASKLRKLFEQARDAVAAAVYDDPPSRAEIEATLRAAGLAQIPNETMGELTTLARLLDPGDFRQTVEKIALYKLGDPSPLGLEDVSACAPQSTEADMDDLLHAVAERRVAEVMPLLRRLQGQGTNAVGLCIGAGRHFRALHAASCDPGGAETGIARLRPPVHWKNRDRMAAQVRGWGRAELEWAMRVLTETDLALRSSTPAPAMALLERALLRLARRRRG